MPKKKIAFVSPVGNGGPTELYKQLVPFLNEKYGDIFECTLIHSTLEWLKLHANMKRYDIIISVLPFLWKPPHCRFILNIHGDYRMDQGMHSVWALLAYLYPYSTLFADCLIFPSEYLKKTLWFTHQKQLVIGNFCAFPIKDEPKVYGAEKRDFTWITTTNWNNPHKAKATLELIENIYHGSYGDRKITWNIIGGWWEKYETDIQNILQKRNSPISLQCLGFKKNEEVVSLLNESDIFIYATHAESFGIAILEAASQWLPLVLMDHPAFHGLWDESSIHYSYQAISEELIKLMNSIAYCQNQSTKSVKNVQKFSQENILEKWIVLLTKI